VCIELSDEDMIEEDRKADVVGMLRMRLYGTRDAANNLQSEVAKEMSKWGFKRGTSNPCLHQHRQLGIKTLVHGDDFVSIGTRGIKE